MAPKAPLAQTMSARYPLRLRASVPPLRPKPDPLAASRARPGTAGSGTEPYLIHWHPVLVTSRLPALDVGALAVFGSFRSRGSYESLRFRSS
jgi:hypothetical protein